MRTFDDVVGSHAADVQALALQARKFLLAMLPGAEERVDTRGPYVSYGYGPGYKGIVCYLTISKTGVKLGIAESTGLPDPRRLLRGSGKSHRHVPLTAPADLRQPGLRPLVRSGLAAWQKRHS
jgi:hypothetical protein